MKRIAWRLLLVGAAALVGPACSKAKTPATETPTPTLTVVPGSSTVKNDGSQVGLIITAKDAAGHVASGTVSVAVDHGDLDSQGVTENLTFDANGNASAKYSCNASKESDCVTGVAKFTVGWAGNTATAKVGIVAVTVDAGPSTPDAGVLPDGGIPTPPDAGFSGDPRCLSDNLSLSLYTLSPSSLGVAGGTLPTSSNLQVLAQFPDGTNATGCAVTFAETPGEHLLSLSGNTVAVDGSGLASITLNAGQNPGTATVQATLGHQSLSVSVPVVAPQQQQPDGGLTGANIRIFSVNPPPPLNTAGTGPSSTTISVLVTYSNGSPAAGVQVNFAQETTDLTPVLLSTSSAITDASGVATVVVTAGSSPGHVNIVCSLAGAGAITTESFDVLVGAADGGSCGDLTNATLSLFSLVPNQVGATGSGLGPTAQLTVMARLANGNPATGCPVTFAEQAQEFLVAVSAGAVIADQSGLASVTLTSGQAAGDAHITVQLGSTNLPVTLPVIASASQVTDGGLSGASLSVFSINPTSIDTVNSGPNNSSTIQFQLKRADGSPAAGVQVNFAQEITDTIAVLLSASSAITDASGVAAVTVTSGSGSGTANIKASVPGTGLAKDAAVTVQTAQPDGGACPDLTGANVTVFALSPSQIGSVGSGLQNQTTLTVKATLANGAAASGCGVNFAEQNGEFLLAISAGSVVVDPSGLASVTLTAGTASGNAHVIVTLGTQTLPLTIPIAASTSQIADGGLSGATLTVFSVNPNSLNTVGSGQNTTSTVQLLARQANGAPASGVRITIGEDPSDTDLNGNPATLVALSGSSVLTDASGVASFSVTAGGVAGTAHINVVLLDPNTGAAVANQVISLPLVTVPDAGPNLTGSTITAVNVFPSYIVVQGGAGADGGISTSTTVTFQARDSNGAPLAGETVTFAEAIGESLVDLSPTSGVTSATGQVGVTVTSRNSSGIAHIVATLAGSVSGTAQVPILGSPTVINFISQTPTLLGIQGSGVQENGQMVFQVTDSLGNPVPSATVNFTEAQPQLVTLVNTSQLTDNSGQVTVAYSSGPEVGVTSITATVATTGANIAHPVAVRGAKPSASGFYFACDTRNLPVYTTTPELETVTCHVRLADRLGNRVGISVPVNFATEAGAITASVLTAAYDPNNPSVEGTADVTFTSDFGASGGPADVVPLLADPNQFPFPRADEPARLVSSQVFNPRDQLVTVIAMTQGEEAFQDSNHNGVLDNGEIFIDEGAPFVDSNDDNVYDQVVPGGPYEKFFCANTNGAQSCNGYQGPNGQWDSNTTIWTPFYLVFTGPVTVSTLPATAFHSNGTVDPGDSFPATVALGDTESADLFAYDDYLNRGSATTSYSVVGSDVSAISAIGYGLISEADNKGSMQFEYKTVSAADGGQCTATNGTACVNHILFGGWDTGAIGTVSATNGAAPTTCNFPDGGSGPATTSVAPFDVLISATNAHSLLTEGAASGTYIKQAPCGP